MAKFQNIFRWITGVSTPLGGISWQIQESEKTQAHRIITYLKSKRALFEYINLEVPQYCVESILQVKEFLVLEQMKLDSESRLYLIIGEMVCACNSVLTQSRISLDGLRNIWNRDLNEDEVNLFFYITILRKVFKHNIMLMNEVYGLEADIEFIERM